MLLRPGEEPIPGYQIERFLGKGQFGQVWKAKSPGKTYVALKFLDLSGKQGRKEFRAIQQIKQIRHAHLMPITALWLLDEAGDVLDDEALDDIGADSLPIAGTIAVAEIEEEARSKPVVLVVAQLLGDKTLGDRLSECRQQGEAGIPVPELLTYMEEAAKGIDFLNSAKHELGSELVAVQHCDIKPANILLMGESVLICDYGVAHVLAAAGDSARATSMIGSPAYMAPECIDRQPSPTSDQYSLAITYVELRTGKLPFKSESFADVLDTHRSGKHDLAGLPPAERLVIQKATSLDPRKRYASSHEMVRELRQAALGEQVVSKKSRSVAILCIALAVCIGCIIAVVFGPDFDPGPGPDSPPNNGSELANREVGIKADDLIRFARNRRWTVADGNLEIWRQQQENVLSIRASLRENETLLDDSRNRKASFLAVSALFGFYVENGATKNDETFDTTFDPLYQLFRGNGDEKLVESLEAEAERAMETLKDEFRGAAEKRIMPDDITGELTLEQSKIKEIYPGILDDKLWKRMEGLVVKNEFLDALEEVVTIDDPSKRKAVSLWIRLRNPDSKELGEKVKEISAWLAETRRDDWLDKYCEALDRRLGSAAPNPEDVASLCAALKEMGRPDPTEKEMAQWYLHVMAAVVLVDSNNGGLNSLHGELVSLGSQLFTDPLISACILLHDNKERDVDLCRAAGQNIEAAQRLLPSAEWPGDHPFRDVYVYASLAAAMNYVNPRAKTSFEQLKDAGFRPTTHWFIAGEGTAWLRDVLHKSALRRLSRYSPLIELESSARKELESISEYIGQNGLNGITDVPTWIVEFTDKAKQKLSDANLTESDAHVLELVKTSGFPQSTSINAWVLRANATSHAAKSREKNGDEAYEHRSRAIFSYGALLDWTGGYRARRKGIDTLDVVKQIIVPAIDCWNSPSKDVDTTRISQNAAKMFDEAGYILHHFSKPDIRNEFSKLARRVFPSAEMEKFDVSQFTGRLELTERFVREATRIDPNEQRWWITLADVVADRRCKGSGEYQDKIQDLQTIMESIPDDPWRAMYGGYTNVLESRTQRDPVTRLDYLTRAKKDYERALKSLREIAERAGEHESDVAQCYLWLSGVYLDLANYDGSLSSETKRVLFDNAGYARKSQDWGFQYVWECFNAEGNAVEDLAMLDLNNGRRNEGERLLRHARQSFANAKDRLTRDASFGNDAQMQARTELNYARSMIRRFEYKLASEEGAKERIDSSLRIAEMGGDVKTKIDALHWQANFKSMQLRVLFDPEKICETYGDAFQCLETALNIAAQGQCSVTTLPDCRMEMIYLLDLLVDDDGRIFRSFANSSEHQQALVSYEKSLKTLLNEIFIRDRTSYRTEEKVVAFRTMALFLVAQKTDAVTCWDQLDKLAGRIASLHPDDLGFQHYMSCWKSRAFLEVFRENSDEHAWEYFDKIDVEVKNVIEYAKPIDNTLWLKGLSCRADFYYERLMYQLIKLNSTPPKTELETALDFFQTALNEAEGVCKIAPNRTKSPISQLAWSTLETVGTYLVVLSNRNQQVTAKYRETLSECRKKVDAINKSQPPDDRDTYNKITNALDNIQ